MTHRLGLLGRRRGRFFRGASRLHVLLQLGFGKVDGLDVQTGVAEHLHDLLAHVFGIGARLGLGQLLAQFQRVVLGLGDLPGTLLCVAGAASRGQEHDRQADEQQDDWLHKCPPFRPFPRLHNSNNGSLKKRGGGPPGVTPPSGWEAVRRFAGITHRRIRRRRAPPGSWRCGRVQSPGPRDWSLETSVLGLQKSPSVHCSKPTARLAYGWCRRMHHVFRGAATTNRAVANWTLNDGTVYPPFLGHGWAAFWWLWLAADNHDSELRNQRGDCANGGEERSQDGAAPSNGHGNLDERVAVLVLHDDALDVALVDQVADLINEVAAQDLNFFNNILETHGLEYVGAQRQVPKRPQVPSRVLPHELP